MAEAHGRLVAHAVGLEIAFHGLLEFATHQELHALGSIGLNPPCGRRSQTRQNSSTFVEQANRLDRVDVVVCVASAQDAKNQGYLVDQNMAIVTSATTGLCWYALVCMTANHHPRAAGVQVEVCRTRCARP